MVKVQNLTLGLLRACRRSSSPAISPAVRSLFSSSLLSITEARLSLSSSSSFSYHVSTFSSSFPTRLLNTVSSNGDRDSAEEDTFQYETTDDVEVIDEWEEEEEAEPQIGDGGDGGGVVLRGVPWGERALSIAVEVLKQFSSDVKLFAFRTSPRGYIYVRLDKLSNEYGCPTMEELEGFSQEYKKRLDEAGAAKIVPEDLALEVSSPGAERLLIVPDDLNRFKEMPMRVSYIEETNSRKAEKSAVFLLESVDSESEHCVWKLADVRENRDPESKGRPLSRKQKDLRFNLPFEAHRRITLYLD
ncbi:PREDICTED: uncharacterized protein LOC104822006 isoform X2 [Tarenaya hassleriana]|uniref:uncharacterized protein LOC104822006 isoform X2 n=1 Tax=Tarenaya hassleriana TaxID=28532 RepID=UPI00053C2A88|nr:PREDICTED: uncharacterized protein LOC104822006 isoform X2 [Tarenaya hassleriana]